jgi:hypothetical protein
MRKVETATLFLFLLFIFISEHEVRIQYITQGSSHVCVLYSTVGQDILDE